ncbi:fused MFS/spermidine synthase [soil metagenome]
MFAVTLFASAALSFLVQPLVARQMLPLAGGAPAVWTTSLVVFQTLLLGGYLYAHALQRLTFRFQLLVHAFVLVGAASVVLLPDSLQPPLKLGDWIDASPVTGVALGLLQAAGWPFFLLSTTAPLLQAWYARSGKNPYPLYAASNAGSLLGLLAYPFAVEPFATLTQQRRDWTFAFIGVCVAILLCGLSSISMNDSESKADGTIEPLSRRRVLKWTFLAALTASLLASVTAHLSTDIAPMPLLWVVPLAVYLLTYIMTFAKWPDNARRVIGRVAPMALCFVSVALLSQATEPMMLVAGLHLFGLFAVGLLCHGELAADRPAPRHLTAFYLALAVGGVLGGFFNAVIAPVVFSHIGPVEYPLAIVLAALVRPMKPLLPLKWSDMLWPLAVLVLSSLLLVFVPTLLPKPAADDEAAKLLDRVLRGGLMFGVPVTIAFALVWRPVRFACCLAAILGVGGLARFHGGGTLEVHRNFFGTLRVSQQGDFNVLTHGTTNHGQQRRGESPPQPGMYYHRKGPVGRVFTAKPATRVGVVGLGCGAMAAYAEPGQTWTFFEIDPGVVDVARNANYFTFLTECKATSLVIVLGDARRKLAMVPDGSLDLLAIDAFSSDAVPVHLLTREAFELYFRKLAPDGRLLLHLSNRYLDLPSLAGRVIQSIDPEMVIRVDEDLSVSVAERAAGREPSTWMIATKNIANLGRLPAFTPFHAKPGPVWTDNFAPLSGVWKRDDD